MNETRDRERLKYTAPDLRDAYFAVAARFELKYPGASLTIPQEGGYRTPPQQVATNKTGASGYSGALEPGATFSKHQVFPARGLDFGVIDTQGHLVRNGRDPFYLWCGEQFEAMGFKWGGRFHKLEPDWDHVEIPGPQPSMDDVRKSFAEFKRFTEVGT